MKRNINQGGTAKTLLNTSVIKLCLQAPRFTRCHRDSCPRHDQTGLKVFI